MNPYREAAARLVALGWPVFPVNGKVPHKGTRGFKDATKDPSMLDRWWRWWPGSGVAVPTGRASGFWALDVDGDLGERSLRTLTNGHGPLPETVNVRTPGGGWHFYFSLPAWRDVRNSAKKIAPGLDVRGTGGYVVVPPSPHPDGGWYAWRRDPWECRMAEAPSWLLDLLESPKPEEPPPPPDLPDTGVRLERYVDAAIDAECRELARTPPGSRNDRLNRAAFALARFVVNGVVTQEYIAARLAHAAATAGLGQWEIESTLRSAFKARRAS